MRPSDADWSFETPRFFVGFYAEPEDMDPADSFEFEEDIDAVRNGDVEWFQAAVRVFLKPQPDAPEWEWVEVGSDHLGGCAYASIQNFYTGHRDPDPMARNCAAMRLAKGGSEDAKIVVCHYFPDMVAQAVAAARQTLRGMPFIRAAASTFGAPHPIGM